MSHRISMLSHFLVCTDMLPNIDNRYFAKNIFRQTFSGRKHRFKNVFAGISYEKELYARDYSFVEGREAQSVGLELGYKWGATFVKTGVDFQKVKDAGFYEITYLQNEVVGSELRVDSVIYEHDSEQHLIRKYITSEVKIYDSLEHSVQENPVNHYSYLRIPFAVGYRHKLSKILLTASLGTEFSVLVAGEEPVPVLQGEELRVTRIIQKSGLSPKTDWQILFSGGVYYPLADRLMIGTEILYRTDVEQVYNTDNKSFIRPFSWSVRTGLKYNF